LEARPPFAQLQYNNGEKTDGRRNGRSILGCLLVTLQIDEPNGRRTSRAVRNTLRFVDDLIASMQIGSA
jgi:hypothetical protein